MAALATRIFICLILTCWLSACSAEEKPQSLQPRPKIVKPIVKPAPKAPVSPTGEEGKKVGLEEQPSRQVATVGGDNASPASAVTQKEKTPEEESGYYTVRKGESLSSIAGRKETYSDSMKWPILLRMNLDKLGDLPPGEDFPERALPEGIRLKILTSEEAKENAQKQRGHVWVINVLSSTSNKEIVPAAVALAKKGYPIYITRGNVKGKDWMRLRVGFFESKRDADALGKKIQNLMNLGDPWITKAKKEEFREFAGF